MTRDLQSNFEVQIIGGKQSIIADLPSGGLAFIILVIKDGDAVLLSPHHAGVITPRGRTSPTLRFVARTICVDKASAAAVSYTHLLSKVFL